MTKTQQQLANARLRVLRTERKAWRLGRYVPWGAPWCDGPGSPHHQAAFCEGCATVSWCRDHAAGIGAEIARIEASMTPAVQGGTT